MHPDDEEDAASEAALDSSDDEGSDDELIALADVMPENFEVAPIPTVEQLTFRSELEESLVGLNIIVNWTGVGWIAGEITKANHDGRKKSVAYPQTLSCNTRMRPMLHTHSHMICMARVKRLAGGWCFWQS